MDNGSVICKVHVQFISSLCLFVFFLVLSSNDYSLFFIKSDNIPFLYFCIFCCLIICYSKWVQAKNVSLCLIMMVLLIFSRTFWICHLFLRKTYFQKIDTLTKSIVEFSYTWEMQYVLLSCTNISHKALVVGCFLRRLLSGERFIWFDWPKLRKNPKRHNLV